MLYHPTFMLYAHYFPIFSLNISHKIRSTNELHRSSKNWHPGVGKIVRCLRTSRKIYKITSRFKCIEANWALFNVTSILFSVWQKTSWEKQVNIMSLRAYQPIQIKSCLDNKQFLQTVSCLLELDCLKASTAIRYPRTCLTFLGLPWSSLVVPLSFQGNHWQLQSPCHWFFCYTILKQN